MKKSKLIFFTLVILFTVGAAFTLKPHHFQGTLYYYNGSGQYFPAGVEGYNYACIEGPGVCTYYKQNQVYYPYAVDAQYFPIQFRQDTTRRAKKKAN